MEKEGVTYGGNDSNSVAEVPEAKKKKEKRSFFSRFSK